MWALSDTQGGPIAYCKPLFTPGPHTVSPQVEAALKLKVEFPGGFHRGQRPGILALPFHFPRSLRTCSPSPTPNPQAQTIPAILEFPGTCGPAQPGQTPCAAGTCAQGHAQGGLSRHCGSEGPPPAQAPQGSAPDSCSTLPGERKGRIHTGNNNRTVSPLSLSQRLIS